MRSILEEEVSVERRGIELQHINVKLWLKDIGHLDLDPLIPVFHGWIQDQVFDELLLDVADYRHVPGGPGVVLIGHEADYSVDHTDDRWGVRYNRKAVVDKQLEQAARSALRAARFLEEDTRLNRKLCFNGQDIEVFVNDRLLAPNDQETRVAVEPEFREFFSRLFAGGEYSLSLTTDSRRLLGAVAHSGRTFSVAQLLENLDV
jgi:hypothetical protein